MVRRLHGRRSAGQPDRRRLHSVLATQIITKLLPRLGAALQNSSVSVIMCVCAAVLALAASAFHQSTSWLVFCAVAVVVIYHFTYQRVART
jgi:predicted Na+-dependent transporter